MEKSIANKKTKTSNITYQSNPFYLCFDDFGNFFEKNLWWAVMAIGYTLIAGIISFVMNLISMILDSTSEKSSALSSTNPDGAAVLGGFFIVGFIIFIVVAIAMVISILINTFVGGVYSYVALQNNAGRSVKFSEAINAVSSRFGRLFLAQLLASLKIIAWSFLLIIPGIIATFRYALLPFVILDEPPKNKGVVDSHNRIKALVAGRKREVFGVSIVASLIPIVGILNQLIGNAKLYRQLQIFHDNNLQKPSVHWLNYLGFVLVGLIFLVIIGIAALAAILATAN